MAESETVEVFRGTASAFILDKPRNEWIPYNKGTLRLCVSKNKNVITLKFKTNTDKFYWKITEKISKIESKGDKAWVMKIIHTKKVAVLALKFEENKKSIDFIQNYQKIFPPNSKELPIPDSQSSEESKTNTVPPREKKSEHKLIILVQISRLIPISAALLCFAYLIYLTSNSDNWSTDPNTEDSEILRREASRGLFVSVVIAILMNIIGAFMFYIRVRESLVVINYGFILGPVIGFMLDQSVGSDAGFQYFMSAEGVSYTFSSLIGGNFMRYIVTVFLDLFISNPLQDTLKTQVAKIGVIKALNGAYNRDRTPKHKWLKKYDGFVALNFPSILQSIVAFVTFNAYTNQTRFAWAYPALTLDRELRIPPGTVMLGTAIAGVLYLVFYTIMDYISERDYFDVNTKLGYVLAILALLYGLNQTESIEAPVEGEIDVEYTESITSAKPYLGMLVFSAFVLYGFVYPVYTRLGCCGRCKPREADTDHLADMDEGLTLNAALIGKIKTEVRRQIRGEMGNDVSLKTTAPPTQNNLKKAQMAHTRKAEEPERTHTLESHELNIYNEVLNDLDNLGVDGLDINDMVTMLDSIDEHE